MTNNWKEFCKSFIPKVKQRHQQMLGRPVDLVNPLRFTDKLEWLKIYDSTFLKSLCADKYLARKYVANKIGHDISIPVLGVYDSFNSIDFSKLPQNYVLKTNHGSHTNIIVRGGNINKQSAELNFNNWMSKDWSWWGYELHYIPIKRKIIAEEYKNDGNCELTDYKFLCFNGKPLYCQVIADRHTNRQHLNYYNMKWESQETISRNDFPANYNITHKPPKQFDKMIEYASKLSLDFKFVRVDFYEIDEEIYFGELTFIPGAAYFTYQQDSTDYAFGKLLSL